jgi:hypothetical protein
LDPEVEWVALEKEALKNSQNKVRSTLDSLV